MNYQERLLKVIPGGAHTYSRGYDQYPQNAPQILSHGKGAYVFTPDNQKFLDYGMSLRAVTLGYAEDAIDDAAIAQIRNGNNLTRPSMIELEAAERLVSLIDSVDMVKFTKNGSTSVSAAVKLARAYTGRNLVARCSQHPFFSYDDWFIGSTPITRGIPLDTIEKTKFFSYNDIGSLMSLIEHYPAQIACVVLEPATTECPALSDSAGNYLQQVQKLCNDNGIVFILDEMITGFRWHLKGAQFTYGVTPDICTFGKAMANGFSVSCVAGRRDIMQQGSIEFTGQERLFLLSTTHGAEMNGLGAFVKTVEFYEQHKVIAHLWNYGQRLIALMNEKARAHGVEDFFIAGGIPCSPWYATYDSTKQISLPLRTLFLQEMVKGGVLMPWIALSWRHRDEELAHTSRALDTALTVYRKALDEGVANYLVGPSIKPVFRKYN